MESRPKWYNMHRLLTPMNMSQGKMFRLVEQQLPFTEIVQLVSEGKNIIPSIADITKAMVALSMTALTLRMIDKHSFNNGNSQSI